MKRSIILEGYDGSGKSYLASQLREKYSMPVIAAGPPARHILHALDCCNLQLIAIKDGSILDRVTPISRICYQTGITTNHFFELTDFLYRMLKYSTLIWCVPDQLMHVRSTHDTDEHIRDIEKRKESIQKEYKSIMSIYNHIKYNRNIMSFDELCRRIEENE